MTMTFRDTKGSVLTHPELDENFRDLAGRDGWFDYNDLATASAAITITGGAGDVDLTNDELGAFTNKTYPPRNVSDVWDASGGVFDWSELALGDMVDIRLDIEATITSNNTEVGVDLHLGTGGGAYVIPFIGPTNIKTTGTYRGLRMNGIYMGDANTLNNGGKFKMFSDTTCTVKVNGWYCKIHRYTG